MTAPGKPKRPAKTKPLGVNPAFVGSRPTLADAAVGVPLDAYQTDVLRLLHQIDASLRNEANEQFEERFKPPRPARTVVGISSIPFGGQCVIDVIAHR